MLTLTSVTCKLATVEYHALKRFFSLYIFFISLVFTQLSRTPNHFPLPRHWTRDRDFGPATATLDPRPRLWTRDPRPATRDPRPATISQTPMVTSYVSLMKQKYISYWQNTLQHSQKLEFYRSFKTDNTTSSYLDLTRVTAGRRALVKLQISNHKLMIELGGYN